MNDAGRLARCLAQREANGQARDLGLPLPFPNIWDEWDPTKVDRDATIEEIHRRYQEFKKLCRRRPKRRHAL